MSKHDEQMNPSSTKGSNIFTRWVRKHKHLSWIMDFWKPHTKWLWVLGILTLLSSGVALAFPLIFMMVIDELRLHLGNDDFEMGKATTTKAIWIFAAIGLARTLTHLYPGFRAGEPCGLRQGCLAGVSFPSAPTHPLSDCCRRVFHE